MTRSLFSQAPGMERYKTCQKTLTRLCIKLEPKENTMKRLMLIAFGAILTVVLAVPGWSQNTTGTTTQSQTQPKPTTQKETKEEKKARKEADRAKKKSDKDSKNKQDTTTTNKKY